jgi:hypothetical protein
MFKAGTVAGLTTAQSLVQDTQKDVSKKGIADHNERNNTISTKAQRSSPRVRPLVEIQFFLYFF